MSIIYKVLTAKDSIVLSPQLISDSWQKALDQYSLNTSNNITTVIQVNMSNSTFYLSSLKDIQFWSEFLINNDYNRIEKRLILEDYMTKNNNYKLEKYMPEEKENIDFHGKFHLLSKEDQDKIINPKHYKIVPKEAYSEFPDGLEYMDIMEYALEHHSGVEAHLLGQIFKYSFRIGKKDAKLQDAKKIKWYADRLVEVIESNDK